MNIKETVKLNLVEAWDCHFIYEVSENSKSFFAEVQFDDSEFNGKIYCAGSENEDGELEWEELKQAELYNFIKEKAIKDYNN